MTFEWDRAKAKSNFKLHGVSFELAKSVFRDVFAVDRIDDRRDYGEDRFIILGMADSEFLIVVVYTERDENIRIISARRATKREQELYFEEAASTDVQ